MIERYKMIKQKVEINGVSIQEFDFWGRYGKRVIDCELSTCFRTRKDYWVDVSVRGQKSRRVYKKKEVAV
jgi:hypothetical protein